MDCRQISENETIEKFLLSQLTDPEWEAFEEHLLVCARCREELRMLQALQVELTPLPSAPKPQPAPPKRPQEK